MANRATERIISFIRVMDKDVTSKDATIKDLTELVNNFRRMHEEECEERAKDNRIKQDVIDALREHSELLTGRIEELDKQALANVRALGRTEGRAAASRSRSPRRDA